MMCRHMNAGTLILAIGLMTTSAAAQSAFEIMGYDDLIERLGEENIPTGAAIQVAQVEALSDGSYGPNQDSSQFEGKSFTAMSGPPGNSSHATNVGGLMYGNTSSMAFDVSDIWLYNASHWVQSGFLRGGQSGVQPLAPPGDVKVFNNSWIGTTNDEAFDNDILRRADYVIRVYKVMIVSGVGNGSGSGLPLMSHDYNGIAVGKSEGTHAAGDTVEGLDGPGRMKPEIAAPAGSTSSATPFVSAIVTLLYETALDIPNDDASRTEVIKAVTLAGAGKTDLHDGPWTNNPETSGPQRGVTDRPLDELVGAGTVNINASHLILTAGEQPDSNQEIPAAASDLTGWSLAQIPEESSRYWRFKLAGDADSLTVAATWNRHVLASFSTFTMADVDLHLWRVDDRGNLASLVGDDGLPYFEAGNVVSSSEVDNIEYLYLTGLAEGEYVLEARRIDDAPPSPWNVALAWHIDAEAAAIAGDFNDDGIVDGADLAIQLGAWGACDDCEDCIVDLDDNCNVDGADLAILLGNWG